MKSKFVFILGLSAIVLCGYVAHATIPSMTFEQFETLDTPPGEKIILHGLLMLSAGPDDIEASVTEDNVYIQFNRSFGGVSISLYNSINGLVYSDIVNTDVQQLVIIPIGNEVSGTYTLELNSISGSAEGDFEHNNN